MAGANSRYNSQGTRFILPSSVKVAPVGEEAGNVNPWLMLALFVVGNLIMGPGFLMLFKGTNPPPFKGKANPIVATLLVVVGMTMLLHFGDPNLFSDLRGELGF